jgi:O-antigen/teichoic acid export membrane protein
VSLSKSLGWMGLAQLLALVLQFAGTVVLARYLTPYETGIYAVALATVGMLSLIQSLGLQALIVREEVLTPEIASTAFTVNALIAVLLALAVAGVSGAGGAFLGDPGVAKVLLVLAINPLFGIFSFLPSANLERGGRFRELALIASGAGMVTTLVTIALAVNGFSYMSVAYAQWVNGIIMMVALNIVGRHHVSFRIGFTAWRRVADFGAQMLAVSGMAALSTRLSDLLIGRLLGLGPLGLYTRATNLNGLLWNNIHLVVGRVILVDFAAIHRRGEPLRDRYLRTVSIMTALLWPAFIGLAVLAQPFIHHVYGDRWTPAATPLAMLAIASAIQVSISMTWELFAATGNLRAQTRIEFIRTIVSTSLFAAGCMVSLNAAAAARVADAVFAIFLYRGNLNRMTQTRVRDFTSIYLHSALLTGLATGPAIILSLIYRPASLAPLPELFVAVAAGVALWIAGLFVTGHPIAQEARGLLNRRREPVRG